MTAAAAADAETPLGDALYVGAGDAEPERMRAYGPSPPKKYTEEASVIMNTKHSLIYRTECFKRSTPPMRKCNELDMSPYQQPSRQGSGAGSGTRGCSRHDHPPLFLLTLTPRAHRFSTFSGFCCWDLRQQ
jgi:hypothetical protein